MDSNVFGGFLSHLENEIVNTHRDPRNKTKVLLCDELRKSNRKFIQEFDNDFKEETINLIKVFFKNDCYKKMKF